MRINVYIVGIVVFDDFEIIFGWMYFNLILTLEMGITLQVIYLQKSLF